MLTLLCKPGMLYHISHFANVPDFNRLTQEQSDRLPRAQFLSPKLILGSPGCANVLCSLYWEHHC